MSIFRRIYPEGAIYNGSLLSGSYPHSSGEQFVWDNLTNTIQSFNDPPRFDSSPICARGDPNTEVKRQVSRKHPTDGEALLLGTQMISV
jgi:hypothetical protein